MSSTSPGRATAVPEVFAETRRRRADSARQVADVLRRQVLQGAFPDGLLPGEASLARAFGASRNAIRDAFGMLRAEGLLVRVPGVGTMVAARKYPHGLNRLLGLAETLREHGEVVNEVRAAGTIVPPPAVAARLRAPGGPPVTTVVRIERLRRLNGGPFSLDLTYLVPDIGAPLLGEDLAHHDIFTLIEAQARQALGGASLTVEAVSADPRSAAVLEAPPGAALLMVERLTRLADGRPVDLEYIRVRGDRVVLHGDLRRGAPDDLPLSATEQEFSMPLVQTRADVPVTIDASLCVEGCTLCVDICPLDSLAISPDTGKAYMHVDECWYCGPCAARCPTGAVTVNMPYLLR
jgi:GntR family transcriptional regulator